MDDSKLSRSEFMKRDSKFTDLQKGYLKQFVADCLIKKFTLEESLLYLKDKLGIQVEEDELNYLKGELKRDIRRNVHYLRRYEYAYIREYLDRIDEMRLIQKRLWSLIEDNSDNPQLQKDCLSELCKSTIALADFYKSIKDLDQGNDELNATNIESIHEPVSDTKENNVLKKATNLESIHEGNESETVDENSLEDRPTVVSEVGTSQYNPKKIAKYTSDGKLAPAIH
jgi:hypothetical protein